jgi:sec-independent protein translocase protein TatB
VDILGVGPLELLFIIIIALVVIGPRDIGNAARSFGRFLNRLYRSEAWQMLSETARNLRHLPSQLAREAAIEELREVQKTVEDVGKDLDQDVKSLKTDLQPWAAQKPDTETTTSESESPTESSSDSPSNMS